MKYGETAFDILYLLIAVVSGIVILRRRKNEIHKKMGAAILILGCGDVFHLIPRIVNYFVSADLAAYLGLGKLVTSITMTVFYLYMYHICLEHYGIRAKKSVTNAVYLLALARALLCLMPQNHWLQNESSVLWGTLRNIPFVAMGVLIAALYFRHRLADKAFRHIWLYIALSFLFYIPVAVAAGVLPILGMLMLPKTICYILIIITFYRYVQGDTK